MGVFSFWINYSRFIVAEPCNLASLAQKAANHETSEKLTSTVVVISSPD